MADTDDPFALTPSSPLVTARDASPPAPTPPPDRNIQRMEEAQAREDRMMERAEKSMAREETLQEERASALAPLRQRIADYAAQPLPQIPETRAPPTPPQRGNQQDQETWLMASGLLGALAGAFTRRHQTNALAAFSGAMDGYNEGSRQKFDENMKIWEAENKRALEENSRAMDHYRSILENRKLSMDQMSIQLQMAAQQYDDAGMAAAAQTKNALVIAQHYDKQAEAAQRAKDSSDKITHERRQQQEKEWEQRAQAWITGPEGQATLQAMRDYERGPPPTNARTGYEAVLNRAQWAALAQPPPGYERFDAGKWARDQAAKKIEAQTDARVVQRERIAAAVGRQGDQIQSLNTSIAHLNTIRELGKNLGGSDFPALNELANWMAYELGYPMPNSFDAAKQIVAAEVVKAVVANGGGTKERENAANLVHNADSWATIHDVTRTWESLLAGQMKSIKKRYESITHRTDFDEMLEPETIEVLKHAGVAPEPMRTPPGYRRIGDNRNALEQLGVVFPNYTTGEPHVAPEEAVKQGRQGAGTNWLPWGGKPLDLFGWKTEVAPAKSTPDGWKVEQVK